MAAVARRRRVDSILGPGEIIEAVNKDVRRDTRRASFFCVPWRESVDGSCGPLLM